MKNMSIPQKNAEVIPAFEITLPNQLPGYMLSQLLEVVEQHYGHNSSKVISDHMEVLFDLDTEAVEKAQECGLEMARVETVGIHPKFVSMIGELIRERVGLQEERRAMGAFGPSYDVCPPNCCLYPRTRPTAGRSSS